WKTTIPKAFPVEQALAGLLVHLCLNKTLVEIAMEGIQGSERIDRRADVKSSTQITSSEIGDNEMSKDGCSIDDELSNSHSPIDRKNRTTSRRSGREPLATLIPDRL